MSVRELALLFVWFVVTISGENLRPPYLNLAREKHITISATSTCGEFIDIESSNKIQYKKELYCKLTGSSPYEKDYKDSNLIYGQYCDYCDHTVSDKKHIVNYTIDGTDRWWQSPPLSRGLEYQKVNITINLGQEYHIAYIYIRMANSPRPAVWSLERSTDYGQTFSTWYYFASDLECRTVFGIAPSYNRSFVRDDDVVCETKYANRIPLEGGEMVVSLINDRPNIKNFSYSDTLQRWTRATNIRLRLLRPTTLHSHSIIHDGDDKSVTRRYFYSIRDIGIGGHCQCNGHAESCDKPHPKNPHKMICRCRHNTCGDYCQECCEPYVQKQWHQSHDSGAGAFECEPCQCYGHSTQCVYDEEVAEKKLSIDIHGKYEGGGRCLNCQHHTEGINCERCVRGYFRNFTRKVSDMNMCQLCQCNLKVSTGACAEGTGKCECKPQFTGLECNECAVGYFDYAAGCKPCLCSVNGTADHKCLPDSGRCVCKMNFDGDYCDRCASGYYNFKAGCLPCQCERAGSDGNICDGETGQCPCRLNYQNRTCDTCKNGHYGYPGCLPCVCNHNGSIVEVCDKQTGTCLCKTNFTGQTCEQCAYGFFNHPTCEPCACDPIGIVYDVCDQRGQCHCKPNFSGRQCNQCAPGYFHYPNCLSCSCNIHGSLGLSCDQTTGQCVCKSNFMGEKCQECSPGLFNFPYCEECKCVPAGVRNDFPGCGRHNIPGVLCLCKQNVEGRQCDRCKDGFWNMKANNPLGCEPCDCSNSGTLAHLNTCDSKTGQCPCKLTTQNSTIRCDLCADGYYSLKRDDVFGCEPCQCSLGGSLHSICDKQTGQCVCRPSIVGRECDQPALGHYFPTLHHLKYELEDGLTPNTQTAVRYEFDSNKFEDFSWKGYVRYSSLQTDVQLHVQLTKPTAYQLLIRYKTFNSSSVDDNNFNYKMPRISVNFTSVRKTRPFTLQTFDIYLPQSDHQATYASASSLLTTDIAPHNKYLLTLKTQDPILVDYIVFIPIDYIETQVLQKIDPFTHGYPCKLDDKDECYHYNYPSLDELSSTSHPSSGLILNTHIIDSKFLEELFIDSLTTIEYNRDYRYDWMISKPGLYYLLVDYHTIDAGTSYARVQTIDGDMIPGSLVFTKCPYTFLCRQMVTTLSSSSNKRIIKPKLMTVTNTKRATIILNVVQQSDQTSPIGIHKITAVPIDQFNYDLLRPKFSCMYRSSNSHSHDLPICNNSYKSLSHSLTTPIQIFQAEDYYNEHLKTNYLSSKSTNISVVSLNSSTPNIYVYGRLTDVYARKENYPATFQFHLYYYQLNSSTISDKISLTVNFYSRTGDSQIGQINAPICQRRTSGGCSQIVTLQNGSTSIRLDEPEFTVYLALVNPNTSLLIDYLTVQKIELTKDKILVSPSSSTDNTDRASRFVQECVAKSAPNYDLKLQQASLFCRQALYSLSAAFNKQAYPCLCDVKGSINPNDQCEPYGGQCFCKPNVIGRQCNRCRTGYWGFPDCRLCACPTKICNELTGDCICPPRVTGRYCDQCAARTYGFDPLIGCEDCQCRIEGVINGRLDCDLRTGQCPCRDNIGSRTCNRCAPGHYDYPRCMRCDCDSDGTREPICDTYTGTCLCKENVYGPRCDRCVDGTFALSSDNPNGCIDCYCFGSTTECRSGLFNYGFIYTMSDWSLTRSNISFNQHDERLTMFMNYDNNDPSPIYWSAPRLYLGNKILAYGGNLTFQLSYTSPTTNYNQIIHKHPLVIFRGRDLTIVYYYSRPLDANQHDKDISITLKEVNFRFQTHSTTAVTRDTFLQTLSNLSSLHILAWPYSSDSTTSSISNIQLQLADLTSVNNILTQRPLALNIEVCSCPANYAGTSCETCAQGYFKQYSGTNGAHSYTCVPCQCYGQSDTCDVETGHCLACQNHTIGIYCEKCKEGYHGDPTKNIPCRICSCPLSIESNNFASTCEMNRTTGETIKCYCQQGYYGDRCQSCYPAYWGQPDKIDSRCMPCQCNSNIDPYDWNACDQQTGRCINCLNNTDGHMCERCQDWFYGDAVREKNCAPCTCSQCGSIRCDHVTGRCQCRPGVTGATCDICLDNHYGYHTCDDEGCKPCSCGLGSMGPSCDLYTGQCQCKPGVGGRNCDSCLPGYWDLTANGCKLCQCDRFGTVRDISNTGLSCDAQTGRCYCIDGVRGERCDQCEEFYTIVEGRGCLPCDKSNIVPEGWCARQLIDDVDQLCININATIENANRIIQGRTANERIKRMRLRANKYRSLVNKLDTKKYQCLLSKNPSSSFCLNEQIVNLTRLFNEFDHDSNQTRVEIDYEQEEVKQLLKRVQKAHERVLEQAQKMKNFADEIDAFSANLTQHTNDDPTYIINLIDSVYTIIDQFDIQSEEDLIRNFSQSSTNLYNYLQSLSTDLNNHLNAINKLNNQTFHFEQRTLQMEKYIQQADEKLQRISDQVTSSDDITLIRTKLKQSIALKQTTDIKLANLSQTLNNDLIINLNQLQSFYHQTLLNATALNNSLQISLPSVNETIQQNNRIHNDIRQIFTYVRNLTQTSQYLKILYKNMKEQNNFTLLTIFVYKNIIDTVNSLDLISNELIKNLSSSQEHIYRQRQRVEQLEQEQLDSSLISSIETRIQLNINDEQRLEHALNSAKSYEQSLNTSEKLLPAYKLRIDELKLTADNLEPHSTRMYDRSQSKTNEFARLRKKILAEKPINASTISDRPLHMEFTDIIDSMQQIKRWELETDEQLRLTKYSYDQTIDLQENIASIIADIHRLVDESRSIVSSVRVGAQFNRSSGVKLHKPYSKSHRNLNKQHSKIALSFRTTESDGLLAYAGKEDDDRYMSLTLNQDGQIEFTYDLGQQRPLSIVTPQSFTDNRWYDVTGERIGLHGHLTIIDDSGKDIFVGTSDAVSGGQSMLDLSDDRSVLLIGGVPSQVSLKRNYPFYSGSISNVRLDDYSLSLWNFQSAINYNQGAIPAMIHHEAVPGISLKGDGYVIFSKRRLRRLEHSFTLTIIFKTQTSNGLLLAYGGGDFEKRFFAIQIIDSHPEILINTGSGLVSLRLEDNVHDNKLHRLQIKKQNTEIIVQLDNQPLEYIYDRDEESRIEGGNDNIYVGKYLGQDSLRDAITTRGFSGCIQSIVVDRNELTLKSEHFKRSGNVETVCSIEQILSTVQFNFLGHEGYAEITEKNLTTPWAITARFQSTQSSGTILYMYNENKYMNKLIIYIEQNHLMIKHKDLPVIRCSKILSSKWWNYIGIFRDTQSYRLFLNDTECGSLNIEGEYNNYQLFKTIFIGGVPPTLSSTMERLIGCIGDINIDGSLVNFNNIIKLRNAERNCQTNIISTINYNRESIVYPSFNYNATQLTYSNEYQLKLFQFNDDYNNQNRNLAILPSVDLIDEIFSSTSETNEKSTNIISMENNELDEDYNSNDDLYQSQRSCNLPRISSNNRGQNIGYRFGDDYRESRALVTITEPFMNLFMNISFKFRTRFTHGLLFYSGNNPNDTLEVSEFIAVWLHRGRLVFAFDCGSGKGGIESINRLNDDHWHQIDIIRNGNNATLFIDSYFEGFITPPGTKTKLETDGIYYFGNIPSDETFLLLRRRQLHHFKSQHYRLQFQGCLSTIRINNQPIILDSYVNNEYNYNIQACYENEESGIFINGEKEIILEDSFRLGRQFNISFHFKSRVKSGLLLAATNINDDTYLLIYLDEGNLIVTLLQNNIDEVHVVHWSNDNHDNEMCDGHWHTIHIQKDMAFIRLYVDKYEVDEELLSIDFDLDTNGPLYIGRMDNLPPIIDDIPVYIGCITNLKIIALNNELNSIRRAKALHTVDGIQYSCPMT